MGQNGCPSSVDLSGESSMDLSAESFADLSVESSVESFADSSVYNSVAVANSASNLYTSNLFDSNS